jgi:hypothetical protein
MRTARVIGLAILAAVAYGVAHDQVTVRLSLEYFTIGHPRLIDTRSPTLLALFWGVVATWWVGLPLGILLALAARIGKRPKLTASQLVRPILRLLGVMAICAALAATAAASLAAAGMVHLVDALSREIPKDRQTPFIAVSGAHLASYAVGAIGGIVLALLTWRRRKRMDEVIQWNAKAHERQTT